MSLLTVLLFAVVGMLWAVTGKSPFVQLVWLGIHGETARIVGMKALALAWRYFAANYRAVVRVRKLEAF